MAEDTTATSCNPLPPITLQSLQNTMLRFEDRMRACPVAVKVGDADLFKANLREEGFCRTWGIDPLFSIQIVVDETMPPDMWQLVYK